MKTRLFLIGLLCSLLSFGQHEPERDITVSERQNDDIYRAGENIIVDAQVDGDVVLAGSRITVRDSIYQDLIVAGGEIVVKGHVADDIRAAGGKLTIDSEVGDDVIVAGGEVLITKNAIIHGNLINFSGDIEMNGKVDGMIKSYAGDLKMNGSIGKEAALFGEEVIINGEIKGTSKIAAETISIGENAMFHGNVAYWSEGGEVDFKNSLMGKTASFDETLMGDQEEFSWKGFGIAALGFWIFYLFSAFLVILLLNWAFSDFFNSAATNFEQGFLKSLGYGLLYIFGLPLLIMITFVIVIGIPIGLFLSGFYLFSLLFGHLVTALLLSHYLRQRSDAKWSFWNVVLLALAIAAVFRLLTAIPILGWVLSLAIIAVGFGLLVLTFYEKRKLEKIA